MRKSKVLCLGVSVALLATGVWNVALSSCTKKECFETTCVRFYAAGQAPQGVDFECAEYDVSQAYTSYSQVGGGTWAAAEGNVRYRQGDDCTAECPNAPYGLLSPHKAACDDEGTWTAWSDPKARFQCDDQPAG